MSLIWNAYQVTVPPSATASSRPALRNAASSPPLPGLASSSASMPSVTVMGNGALQRKCHRGPSGPVWQLAPPPARFLTSRPPAKRTRWRPAEFQRAAPRPRPGPRARLPRPACPEPTRRLTSSATGSRYLLRAMLNHPKDLLRVEGLCGQLGVAALAGEQAGVVADLDDAAMVQPDDLVGVADGGQAVRDGDGRAGRGPECRTPAGRPARFRCPGAGGLVEDEHGRVRAMAQRRFSRTVVRSRQVSWLTMPTMAARSASRMSRRSVPSMRTMPRLGSYSRATREPRWSCPIRSLRPRPASLITETLVLSRPVTGRNRPFCRVVKAIRVPMLTVPVVTGRPAAR